MSGFWGGPGEWGSLEVGEAREGTGEEEEVQPQRSVGQAKSSEAPSGGLRECPFYFACSRPALQS